MIILEEGFIRHEGLRSKKKRKKYIFAVIVNFSENGDKVSLRNETGQIS